MTPSAPSEPNRSSVVLMADQEVVGHIILVWVRDGQQLFHIYSAVFCRKLLLNIKY